MPYSLISPKPVKISEMFQDQKAKPKAKKTKSKGFLGTGAILAITIIVCTLVVSILASLDGGTSDLADFQKSQKTDQVAIRVGQGVQLAQVNANGEIITDNPATFKADITVVTTPDTAQVCEGTCSTNTELELFDEARVYIQQDSAFQINSLDFDNYQAKLSLDYGRVWVRAPRTGQIQLNINPYTITLSDRAVVDLEILDSQVTITQLSRFANIQNENNQSELQITARQSVILERDADIVVSSEAPRTFQDITLDSWTISRMTEERAWLKSQKQDYAEIEFSAGEVNDFLKNWFSFLIISSEERASAKFANLDAFIASALEDPAQLSTYMRQFNSEAISAAGSSEDAVVDYLMSRWEKLRYITPHTKESEKLQEAEYQIKTKIEEAYASITGDYDHFQWERIYSFEDQLASLDTTSALANLEQYYTNLLKHLTKYDASDLNSQLLYLENLFSANTIYIYEDFWNTLFEIEYTVLSQLKPAEANAFGAELMTEKIKQVGYLWLGTDKYNASLVAKTIMGEFSFADGDTQYVYSFFRDNYDTLAQMDSFISVLFEENSSLIEKAMNYRNGKDDYYELTEDDVFAMEFYQEYISYLENKPSYYQRPPSISDVVNRFTELGLSASSAQVVDIPGWIEFANLSQDRFDLSGWFLTEERLENDPTKYYLADQILEPGQYLTLNFQSKTLELSPNGQILYLYDADDNLHSSINYPSIPKGLTYSLQKEGYYGWTQPTPNDENDRLILPKGAQVKNLDDLVISEISPLDQYRFEIANITIGGYTFDTVYDYALNVFSEISSDVDTIALMGELSTMDSDYSDDDVVYYGDVVSQSYFLPTHLLQLSASILPYSNNSYLQSAVSGLIPNSVGTLYAFMSNTDEDLLSEAVNAQIAQNSADHEAEGQYITHTFTFNNFLELPSRLNKIRSEQTYHASSTTTQTSNINATSTQILQTLIRDQLLVHEIYINTSELSSCDTETYTSCTVNNAWAFDPRDATTKIYFSFDYNIETKKAESIIMQREKHQVADEMAVVSLRQAVVSEYQFMDQIEEAETLLVKELGSWGIKDLESNLQYLDTELKEFQVTDVYITESDTIMYLSAIYNTTNQTIRQIKFADGKVFNNPITESDFKKLVDALYSEQE